MPPRKSTTGKLQPKPIAKPIAKPVDLVATATTTSTLSSFSSIPASQSSKGTLSLNPPTALPSRPKPLDVEYSKSQISLALTCLKTKPSNVDTGGYIQHLAKRIRTKLPTSEGDRRCVDNVEYWKDNYSKLYAEKLALKTEIERLKGLSSGSEDEAIDVGDPLRKDVTISLFSCRKRKADTLRPRQDESDDDLSESVKSASKIPLSCLLLIKCAKALHGHISNPNVGPEDLLMSIETTIVHMKDTLKATTLHPASCYAKHEVRQTFQVAAAVYEICLQGLGHLCRNIPGRAMKGKAIPPFIDLFNSVLNWNRNLCHITAKASVSENVRDEPSPASHPDGDDTPSVNIPYLLTARTHFLASILGSQTFNSEPQHGCHGEVLEGLFACLFTRIGQLISKQMFGEEVSNSTLPGHISMIPADTTPDPVETSSTQLETRQMACLLRYVAEQHEGEGEAAGGGWKGKHFSALLKRSSSKDQDGNVSRLMEISKNKLQSTLCKAVFGVDNAEFADALKVPQWDEEKFAKEEGRKSDVGEDFLDVVWQTVGWDILEME